MIYLEYRISYSEREPTEGGAKEQSATAQP